MSVVYKLEIESTHENRYARILLTATLDPGSKYSGSAAPANKQPANTLSLESSFSIERRKTDVPAALANSNKTSKSPFNKYIDSNTNRLWNVECARELGASSSGYVRLSMART